MIMFEEMLWKNLENSMSCRCNILHLRHKTSDTFLADEKKKKADNSAPTKKIDCHELINK